MDSILSKLCQFDKAVKQRRILVFGDVMLDKYYCGSVDRISPEAPVPIVRVLKEYETLGGAANVASNLAGLGCHVVMAGTTGNDQENERLCRLLGLKGIDSSGLFATNRPTITKLRVCAQQQQMIRLDFEETAFIEQLAEEAIKSYVWTMIDDGIDGVAISDYAKGNCTSGLCTYIIQRCHHANIPVLIDPKGPSWEKYRGASIITPNVKELGTVFGTEIPNEDGPIVSYALTARKRFEIAQILVTRSSKGLSLINDLSVVHTPTRSQKVFDVSGAGDAVAAVVIASLAAGLTAVEAVPLANLAAGVVVGKAGTNAINSDELMTAAKQNSSPHKRQVLSRDEVVQLVEQCRREGKKVVFTNGCFDILHKGHLALLENSKAIGDFLIVAINSDESVRRLKGIGHPIVNDSDRARIVAALEPVDCVVIFSEDTPRDLIQAVRPDILVKGGDYREDEVVGREFAKEVKLIPFENGYSTSLLLERIIREYLLRQEILL